MNAIDLFSGAGGLTLATRNSGFDIILSNEVNPVFAILIIITFLRYRWLRRILIT